MNLMNINVDQIDRLIQATNDFLWGWPLIIFFVGAGLAATYMLNFVQIRYFVASWKLLLFPEKKNTNGHMTQTQAFINALNTSIGNGSLAGMAVAVSLGGPGAAFWIFVLGIFSLVIRYCEVTLSNMFPGAVGKDGVLGGPMVYLQKVPGGKALAYGYAFFCLMLSFFSGNSMQCNSVRIALQRVVNIDTTIIALILFAFVIYVMLGGAKRIIYLSERIVPIKVGLFFLSAIIIIAYNYAGIFDALKLIVTSSFGYEPLVGGAIGYSMIEALRYGVSIPLNATEAGLGTAAILFGSTGSKSPVEDGIMSMVSAFISNYLVCFVLAFSFVLTGVWNSGLPSIAITVASYETVFGAFGGMIVTFLSVAFGIGVLVSYVFIARECWSFLTKGRWLTAYAVTYCLFALGGTVLEAKVVWNFINVVNAGLLAINLYAIVMLLPKIAKELKAYENK